MMQLADELWESYIHFMASLSEEGSPLGICRREHGLNPVIFCTAAVFFELYAENLQSSFEFLNQKQWSHRD